MEGPMSSSVKKQVFSCKTADASEESGWTAYLEDFSLNQTKHNSSSYSMDSFGSPSLVSDAAWNGLNNDQYKACPSLGGSQFPKRLNFKNHRIRQKICSDDLEDTASSPVNSPKGKQAAGFDNSTETCERNNMNIITDERNNEGADLKRKGLCLMPMSVFMNYID
ncbi:hypothetical protein Adt_09699 [Abeliophyllum distichum]|uniref:Uncharacterized protein n=1 Tax=Abeliophyllum distichum TaxID=126358 RepID=A0ABD1UJA8_9LAMI